MKINAAIQLLPLKTDRDKIAVIDDAIALIQKSGLKYEVCPFETAVEGEANDVYALIRKVQEQTLKNGCSELLVNIKIHAASRDLALTEKTGKFR